MFLVTAKASVNFDKLPDAAVIEIAKLYLVKGNRVEVIDRLRDRMHGMTYAELDPMFAAMHEIASKHGAAEAVKVNE